MPVLQKWIPKCKETMASGRSMWHSNKKADCLKLYFRVTNQLARALPESSSLHKDVKKVRTPSMLCGVPAVPNASAPAFFVLFSSLLV